MIFTMTGLSRALADHLAPALPDAAFYDGPNQQGTRVPALFLRQTNARIAKQTGDRFLRRLGLDLVYLVRPNLVNGGTLLQAAADAMDECLEVFPYQGALLRTYDRHWEVADDALHYKFELKLWLSRAEDAALMESIQALHMEEKP